MHRASRKQLKSTSLSLSLSLSCSLARSRVLPAFLVKILLFRSARWSNQRSSGSSSQGTYISPCRWGRWRARLQGSCRWGIVPAPPPSSSHSADRETHTHTHISALLPSLTLYPHARASHTASLDRKPEAAPDFEKKCGSARIFSKPEAAPDFEKKCGSAAFFRVLPAFFLKISVQAQKICVLPPGQAFSNNTE